MADIIKLRPRPSDRLRRRNEESAVIIILPAIQIERMYNPVHSGTKRRTGKRPRKGA